MREPCSPPAENSAGTPKRNTAQGAPTRNTGAIQLGIMQSRETQPRVALLMRRSAKSRLAGLYSASTKAQ